MDTSSANIAAIASCCFSSQLRIAPDLSAACCFARFMERHARSQLGVGQAPFWWHERERVLPVIGFARFDSHRFRTRRCAMSSTSSRHLHPALRWVVLLWLLVWLP